MIPNVPQIKEITNEPDFSEPHATGPKANRPTQKYLSGEAADSGDKPTKSKSKVNKKTK